MKTRVELPVVGVDVTREWEYDEDENPIAYTDTVIWTKSVQTKVMEVFTTEDRSGNMIERAGMRMSSTTGRRTKIDLSKPVQQVEPAYYDPDEPDEDEEGEEATDE